MEQFSITVTDENNKLTVLHIIILK